MAVHTNYTNARERLADLLDQVVDNRETVIISRRGKKDVAMIAADELRGIMETIHLFRSPKNAERLMAAYRQAKAGEGTPMTFEELCREVGIDPEEVPEE